MVSRASRCAGSLLVLAAMAACADGDRAPRSAEVGALAPDYSAVALDGAPVSLADRRGKVVLLNIWATWCHPCREEIPVLEAMWNERRDEGLEIIGVSVDASGEEEKIRDFASRMGMTYPIWLEPDERVATLFLAIGVPATYLIDRTGMLLWKHIGPVRADDATLRALIDRAVAAPAPTAGVARSDEAT